MRDYLRKTITFLLALVGLITFGIGLWFDFSAMDQIDSGVEAWVRTAPVQVVFGSALMVTGAILLAAAAIRAAIHHSQESPQEY